MKKMMMIVGCMMAFAVWADLDYLHFAVGQDPAAVVVTFASQPDSRGFTWQTTQDIASGEVAILAGAFGEGDDAAFDAADRRIAARVVEADDDGRPVNVFQAKAYGLAAGGYSYRLGSAGHYVYGTFTVKDAPSALTIVNLSDAQTRQAPRLWKWERTCKAVRDFVGNEKIDFIVHGGDHLDGSFLEAGDNTVSAEDTGHCRYFQWAVATEAMNQYLAGVPLIWSSGNHDYYKGYDFTAEDWSLTNTTTYGCHSFDYGSVHIVSIPFSSENKSVDNDTLAWLEADLQANRNAKWTVLSLHAGPYTTGDNMRSTTVEPAIKGVSSLCARYRVDLVLQAHDHTSSKTRPYRWGGTGWTTDENGSRVLSADLVQVQKIVRGGQKVDVANHLRCTVVDAELDDSAAWYGKGPALTLEMAALPDAQGSGYQEHIGYAGEFVRDNSKVKAWQTEASGYSAYYTVAFAPSTSDPSPDEKGDSWPQGNGYVTLTVDAKGKVKYSGALPDGTKYSGSSVAALGTVGGVPAVRLPLFFSKGSGVFGGWVAVKFPEGQVPSGNIAETDAGLRPTVVPDESDGIVWSTDDTTLTYKGQLGFELVYDAVGGWYDTVVNLQRYYLDRSVDQFFADTARSKSPSAKDPSGASTST